MTASDVIGEIIVVRRFCGPPHSANGGYVAGCLAQHITGSAEVTLQAPPPLERALFVQPLADAGVGLHAGEQLLAVARPVAALTADSDCPTLDEAVAAATRTFPVAGHPVPGCFVCGPGRAHGDGLRIHAGPLDPDDAGWDGRLAADWTPAADLADRDGRILPQFVWAALDCPTAYACATAAGMPPILLGRQSVSILRLPHAGERLIVTAEQQGRDGRKRFAKAALYAAGGEALAACVATWIEVSAERINARA